ncbi:NAD-dependent epimerase/dehydratase family protein [Streptomyces sp. NPDC059740]|uniref:NAD-dependent epimerase/dehydratase family protein n=1 Tax=Streptomyces sp. NPDC059740 TaxID=3346926 RepID=UPI00365FFDA5
MSSVTLTGAVMTHPRRTQAAEALAATDPAGRIRVVTDPDPSGPPTALRTADPSWSCVGEDATHHLVLQDDVLPAEGFFAYVEKVAAAVPDEAVAFYEGWEGRNSGVVRLGALTGAQWAYAVDEHVPSLALMLPAHAARGYAAFAAAHGGGWPYDVVIQRYLASLGIPVRLAVPSTVDHDDVPSIAGNSTHGWRRATFYSARAEAPSTYDCATFPVVPFYQYGEAKCAVRYGGEVEYTETERHLRRIGLAESSRRAYEATARPGLPEEVCHQVWLTGFATGAAVEDLKAPDPDPAVLAAVMESLGPGGLCEDYTGTELQTMIPLVRDLATAAFTAGRAAHRAQAGAQLSRPAATLAVTGGDAAFGSRLARLLEDADCGAAYLADLGQADPRPTTVVHLGDPATPGTLAETLAKAGRAGVHRLVYLGSAAVYRGCAESECTEAAPATAPADPVARAWWDEEEECRAWGRSTGATVQVLRLTEVVGPHAPRDGVLAEWMHLAWTRRAMHLVSGRRHQLLDHRDLATALATLVSRPALSPVYNVSSAGFTEGTLAELVTTVARRTPWEPAATPGPDRPLVSTGLLTAETGWRPTADLTQGARAQAQWLACDTHGAEANAYAPPGRG